MDLATYAGYNFAVATRLGFGDVMRKARKDQRLKQETLGKTAAELAPPLPTAINKNTVSKVERDPFSSEFETVCRLLAALGLTLADVEREVGPVFSLTADALANTPATAGNRTPLDEIDAATAAAPHLKTIASQARTGIARLKDTRKQQRTRVSGLQAKGAQKRRAKKPA